MTMQIQLPDIVERDWKNLKAYQYTNSSPSPLVTFEFGVHTIGLIVGLAEWQKH